MISVVLYGRNDTHGYNLHKRAALGLNCLAEVLTDPDDEVIFVDYNTPDDFPTFPEAIADTLTPQARARLRVLRVRTAVHERFRARSPLQVLEPVARNVGVRRSTAANRWVLSTNPDMILVPRGDRSLSDVARCLPDGYYHLPRFELPESLWEGLDRRDPAGTIRRVSDYGRSLFLNEIVYGPPAVKYDGPGDFQLIRREDLFALHGFDEEMLLGWHVDSNMATRLHRRYGRAGDITDAFFGYHCNHTRQLTASHRPGAGSNDFRRFVDAVIEPEASGQAGSWGCPEDVIEEIRLSRAAHSVYVQGLQRVLTGEWQEPATAEYTAASFDAVTYDARHVLPFLADLFASLPRQWRVGWVGGRPDTFRLFCQTWEALGFERPVLLSEWVAALVTGGARSAGVEVGEWESTHDPEVVVFDLDAPSNSSESAGEIADPAATDVAFAIAVRRTFARLVSRERVRTGGATNRRRFVCINAINNAYETLAAAELAAAATPFPGRMRHGFVRPCATTYGEAGGPEAPNVLADVLVGEAGRRVDAGVLAPRGVRGVVLHGPHRWMPEGRYRVDVTLAARSLRALLALLRPVILEVAAGRERIEQARIRLLWRGRVTLRFQVTPDRMHQPVYVTIVSGRRVEFTVTRVAFTRLALPDPEEREALHRSIQRMVRSSSEVRS